MFGTSQPHHYLLLLGFPSLHLGSCRCVPEQGTFRVWYCSYCFFCLPFPLICGLLKWGLFTHLWFPGTRGPPPKCLLSSSVNERRTTVLLAWCLVSGQGAWSSCVRRWGSRASPRVPGFLWSWRREAPQLLPLPPLTHWLIDVWKWWLISLEKEGKFCSHSPSLSNQ